MNQFLHIDGVTGKGMFPYRNARGDVDRGLLSQAFEMIPQSLLPEHVKKSLLRRAKNIAFGTLLGTKGSGITLEYKGGPLESASTEDSGLVYAYAATWDQDLGDDKMRQGASLDWVKSALPEGLISVLAGHDLQRVIGHPIEVKEDNKGIFTVAQYNLGTFWGNEMFQLVKAGDLRRQSIGWLPGKDLPGSPAMEYDDRGTRFLNRIEVHEFGPLPFAMNLGATIVGAKSMLAGDTSFVNLASQATNAVQVVLIEAEALSARRASRVHGTKDLGADHIEAIQILSHEAKAAVAALDGLLAKDEVPEGAEAEVRHDARAVLTLLDLARVRAGLKKEV